MEIPNQVKDQKVEDLFCGVMSTTTLQPCNLDAFTLVTIDEHGAVFCLCERHAFEVFGEGMPVIVQESTLNESKRYFGVEFPIPSPLG